MKTKELTWEEAELEVLTQGPLRELTPEEIEDLRANPGDTFPPPTAEEEKEHIRKVYLTQLRSMVKKVSP